MGSPLVLTAAEVLRRPGTERSVEAEVTMSELGVDDPRLEPSAAAGVRLRLETLSDGVVVDGAVSVPWVGTCRRCIGPARGVAVADVHELYQPVPVVDPDAFEIEGDYLDLRPMVRESVLLEAPTDPLCRADCAGLCPTCGTDLNAGPCRCTPPPADQRWSALDELRDSLGS